MRCCMCHDSGPEIGCLSVDHRWPNSALSRAFGKFVQVESGPPSKARELVRMGLLKLHN